MIQRRVTEFWKSAIFLVEIALSDNFAISASKCRFNGKHYRSSNDDSLASDSVFQIGHLMGSNGGQLELHRKSSKI